MSEISVFYLAMQQTRSDTDEKRQKRFMKGLNPYMKMQLRLARPREFQELVNVAITFEDDYKNVQDERKKKARMEPKKIPYRKPTPNLNFKPRPRNDSPNPNRGRPNPKSQVICHNCGYKGHYAAECRQPKVICYGCGQPGHMKPNCPNKQTFNPPSGGNKPANGAQSSKGRNFGGNNAGQKGRPFGKLNCTNVEEVIHSDKAVIGTLNIMTYPGTVLFDTGATTSFISKEFIDAYGLKCNELKRRDYDFICGRNDLCNAP